VVQPIGALADEQKSESAPFFIGIKDVSRKGAKHASKKFEARNPKLETRNSKLETKSNDLKTTNSKRAQIGFEVLDFPDLGFILAPVCFGPRGFFRYSDFGF